LSERLAATYVAVGRPVPDAATLATMTADLAARYADEHIFIALARVRFECRFIALVDIVERIPGAGADDGRPGPEEAWALCPKQEENSAVWTTEMAEAFGNGAQQLLRDGDQVAARMAFRECYPRLVAHARREGTQVRWSASLGWDQSDRVRALSEGVLRNRISVQSAIDLVGAAQREELLAALPATATANPMLKGTAEPKTLILPGLPGLLHHVKMEGKLPAGCEPGARRPEQMTLTTEELKQRRNQLLHQAERLAKQHRGRTAIAPSQDDGTDC
jgi:hypothetical protein